MLWVAQVATKCWHDCGKKKKEFGADTSAEVRIFLRGLYANGRRWLKAMAATSGIVQVSHSASFVLRSAFLIVGITRVSALLFVFDPCFTVRFRSMHYCSFSIHVLLFVFDLFFRFAHTSIHQLQQEELPVCTHRGQRSSFLS
jgi:hypothetical protein